MKKEIKSKDRSGERGSAGIKLVVVGVIAILLFHAGYQYIPVAYQGQNFKQDLKTAVINGVSMPNPQKKPAAIVKSKVLGAVKKNQLPADTYVDVKANNNEVSARVYYSKIVPILPFGMYDYQYVFDETSTPNSFTSD